MVTHAALRLNEHRPEAFMAVQRGLSTPARLRCTASCLVK